MACIADSMNTKSAYLNDTSYHMWGFPFNRHRKRSKLAEGAVNRHSAVCTYHSHQRPVYLPS